MPASALTRSRATAGPGVALLVLDDVRMTLNGRIVLSGISMTARAGTATCLAGGNGSGKTTLLRIAAGVFVPRGGLVTVCGFRPARGRLQFARSVGFVTAGNDGVYARLRVRENLELGGAIAYLPRPERRNAVDRALDAYGLRHLAEDRADRLSLGQRQRVRLALGSLHSPPVLLLDEPHTSLDDDGLELLSAAIESHRAAGGAVVWAAPSPEHAPLPYDSVVALERGAREW